LFCIAQLLDTVSSFHYCAIVFPMSICIHWWDSMSKYPIAPILHQVIRSTFLPRGPDSVVHCDSPRIPQGVNFDFPYGAWIFFDSLAFLDWIHFWHPVMAESIAIRLHHTFHSHIQHTLGNSLAMVVGTPNGLKTSPPTSFPSRGSVEQVPLTIVGVTSQNELPGTAPSTLFVNISINHVLLVFQKAFSFQNFALYSPVSFPFRIRGAWETDLKGSIPSERGELTSLTLLRLGSTKSQ
jgi:hypothetical protein